MGKPPLPSSPTQSGLDPKRPQPSVRQNSNCAGHLPLNDPLPHSLTTAINLTHSPTHTLTLCFPQNSSSHPTATMGLLSQDEVLLPTPQPNPTQPPITNPPTSSSPPSPPSSLPAKAPTTAPSSSPKSDVRTPSPPPPPRLTNPQTPTTPHPPQTPPHPPPPPSSSAPPTARQAK